MPETRKKFNSAKINRFQLLSIGLLIFTLLSFSLMIDRCIADSIGYVVGSAQKICQLTGEQDKQFDPPINGTVVPLEGSKPGAYITKVHYQWIAGGFGVNVYYPNLFFPKSHLYLWPGDAQVTLKAWDNYGRWRQIRKTISVW